jgi:hypothetical protein
MGLDMYLHSAELKREINGELVPFEIGNYRSDEFGRSNTVEIRRNVAYWRKANAIHDWFVKHIQDGHDDCESHFVSEGMLAALVDVCERILSAQGFDAESFKVYPTLEDDFKLNPEAMKIAEKELPTRSGFFFGDTSYGCSYVWDLVLTVQQLKPLLESDMDFYYSSSW